MIAGLFRRIFRIVRLIGWTAWVVGTSLPLVMRRGWPGITQGSHAARRWGKGIANIMGLKIRLFGDPESVHGALIVSNHLSYMDIIVHAAFFGPRFSPKSSSKKWPVIGQMIMVNRPVWINRGVRSAAKQTLEEFIGTLQHGLNLVVYPEGSSTDGKSDLIPFKSTAFATLGGNEFPLVPVLTVYRQKAGEPTVCWYGDMTLLPHIWAISGIPEIEVELHVLPPVMPQGRNRKELAAFMHSLMNDKYCELIDAAR